MRYCALRYMAAKIQLKIAGNETCKVKQHWESTGSPVVRGFCTPLLYPPSVRGFCTRVLYQGFVPGFCTRVLYPSTTRVLWSRCSAANWEEFFTVSIRLELPAYLHTHNPLLRLLIHNQRLDLTVSRERGKSLLDAKVRQARLLKFLGIVCPLPSALLIPCL